MKICHVWQWVPLVGSPEAVHETNASRHTLGVSGMPTGEGTVRGGGAEVPIPLSRDHLMGDTGEQNTGLE